MNDIEERLRELGGRINKKLDPDSTMPASTIRRVKHRRRGNSTVGGLVVTMLGVAAVGGAMNLTPPGEKISPSQASSSAPQRDDSTSSLGKDPGASKEVPRDDFFGAVWPEDSREETSQGCSLAASTPDSFRADAVATAVEFGNAVLAWSDGEAVVLDQYRNSKQIELSRSGGSVDSSVTLSMVEYVRDCWSVQSVGANLGDEISELATSVSGDMQFHDEGGDAQSVVSLWLGTQLPAGSSGRVVFAFGDHQETKRWSDGELGRDEPITFRVGPVGHYDAGHYLILLEDKSGRVITAAGNFLAPSKGLARPSQGVMRDE